MPPTRDRREPFGRDWNALDARSGPHDFLIAGQAQARGLVLVTVNMREFTRVDGLACEDWSGPR